jgi:hypothetical protein
MPIALDVSVLVPSELPFGVGSCTAFGEEHAAKLNDRIGMGSEARLLLFFLLLLPLLQSLLLPLLLVVVGVDEGVGDWNGEAGGVLQ